MKRFTDTEKFSDPWYRKLSLTHKLLWSYICDQCDLAGVWKPDLELASFCIGNDIAEGAALEDFKDRVRVLPNGNWFVIKFIPFQYGPELNPNNSAHLGVLRRLEAHSIPSPVAVRGVKGPSKPVAPLEALPSPYTPPHTGPKDKDKDKDKDKEGGVGETKTKVCWDRFMGAFSWLEAELTGFYNRRDRVLAMGEEQALVAEISRRPDVRSEWGEIFTYRSLISTRYFPQSLLALCRDWQKILDRARSNNGAGADKSLTPSAQAMIDSKALDRVERRMNILASNYSSNQAWSDKDREEHKKLSAERKRLKSALCLLV